MPKVPVKKPERLRIFVPENDGIFAMDDDITFCKSVWRTS